MTVSTAALIYNMYIYSGIRVFTRSNEEIKLNYLRVAQYNVFFWKF